MWCSVIAVLVCSAECVRGELLAVKRAVERNDGVLNWNDRLEVKVACEVKNWLQTRD